MIFLMLQGNRFLSLAICFTNVNFNQQIILLMADLWINEERKKNSSTCLCKIHFISFQIQINLNTLALIPI